MDPYQKYTLRRGNLIFNDNTEGGGSDESGGEGQGEELLDEEEAEELSGGGVDEVKWSVPAGFQVSPEPSKLDASLVGEHVYMRWEIYGWQLGKITDEITNATPRLVKKFNYRIVWSDGKKGPAKLAVSNYGHGEAARFDSWVILQQT